LDDALFDDLNRKLKSTGASEYILNLKELYVDFMGNLLFFLFSFNHLFICLLVAESSVFTVEPITGFQSVFGDDPTCRIGESLRSTAKQVSIYSFV
jgi:syntaxin-binding protein 1